MRQVFSDRLKILIKEKSVGLWRDGWVYGRLNQEFDLQLDELNAMTTALGFKYGWNSAVEEILESQWQEDEVRWMQQHLDKAKRQASLNQEKDDLSRKIAELLQESETTHKPRKKLTRVERALIALILKMKVNEQLWVLEAIFNRYRF